MIFSNELQNRLLGDLEARFGSLLAVRTAVFSGEASKEKGELLGFLLGGSAFAADYAARFFEKIEIRGENLANLTDSSENLASGAQKSPSLASGDSQKSPSLAEGDLGGGLLKNATTSSLRGDKVAEAIHEKSNALKMDCFEPNGSRNDGMGENSQENSHSAQNTHPQTPSAREGALSFVLRFKEQEFLRFLDFRLLGGSFTAFAGKIGLANSGFEGKFIKKDERVVLNFPFKDGVLKGAQSADDVKSNEVFFNDILARDEIDVLFAPKILDKFELVGENSSAKKSPIACGDSQKSPSLAEGDLGGGLFSENAENSQNDNFADAKFTHPQTPSAREGALTAAQSENSQENSQNGNENSQNSAAQNSQNPQNPHETLLAALKSSNSNFLIKGNNLLALHSLKKRRDIYGRVKLIYIDPPYNTGSDSFNYNDRFNHSSWLCFMKNRLEIAREFLREDGVIFIQCDDNEQAYLKVLCDEIFGQNCAVNFAA